MSRDSNIQARRRGVVVSKDRDRDRTVETPLRSCCHCGFTWTPHKGSGQLRGFCTRCMGDLCGQPHCVARGCVPVEAELELMEQGIPAGMIREGLLPVRVSVPAEPPRSPGGVILGKG